MQKTGRGENLFYRKLTSFKECYWTGNFHPHMTLISAKPGKLRQNTSGENIYIWPLFLTYLKRQCHFMRSYIRYHCSAFIAKLYYVSNMYRCESSLWIHGTACMHDTVVTHYWCKLDGRNKCQTRRRHVTQGSSRALGQMQSKVRNYGKYSQFQ